MAESSEAPAVAAPPKTEVPAVEAAAPEAGNAGQHVEVDDQIDDGDSAFDESA